MKKCNTCQVEKEYEYFYVNNRNKDKFDNTCKECMKIKNKENRDRRRESQRKWREKNPDYMKEYAQTEKRKEYEKQYYQKNREIYIKRKQEWRKNNPEKDKEERKKYVENNKEKVNKYHSEWKKNKRINDDEYKLKENASRRIRYELNTLLKGKKTKRTYEYLGCSIDELKKYLETQFTGNMSWDNYGKVWHVDHIIPCASWNLSDEFENNCCWNFRNLQPLYASENQSKKDDYNQSDKIQYIEFMKKILI
jgi:hypothetical protein